MAGGITLFLGSLAGRSVQTHKTYRVGCRVFMLFLSQTGRGDPPTQPVGKLVPSVLEDYYRWLQTRYSQTTVTGYLAGPRNLFSYLALHNLTPGGVQYSKMTAELGRLGGPAVYKAPQVDFSQTRRLAEFMYNLPVPDLTNNDRSATNRLYQAQRKLSPNEIGLRRLELLRDRAMILTLYTTGMRREEVSRLDRSDFQEDRLPEVVVRGSGNKERVVFFDEPSLALIREYLEARQDNYRPLFIQHRVSRGTPTEDGANFRLAPFSVWAVVQKWAKEAGVIVKPHDFRHALATSLLDHGAQLNEVQDLLGHASPLTTRTLYGRSNPQALRTSLQKYRPAIDQTAPGPVDNSNS